MIRDYGTVWAMVAVALSMACGAAYIFWRLADMVPTFGAVVAVGS